MMARSPKKKRSDSIVIDLSVELSSNVTIRCGDRLQYEAKGHRGILKEKSTFLRTKIEEQEQSNVSLLIRKSRFHANVLLESSGQMVIDCQDDDPTIVTAILEYMYNFDYVKDNQQRKDWKFHLDVACMARKHQMENLYHKAFDAFLGVAKFTDQIADVVDMLESLPNYSHAQDELQPLAKMLTKKHFLALMKHTGFRKTLAKNPHLMVEYIEHLAPLEQLIEIRFTKRSLYGFGRIGGQVQESMCVNKKCGKGKMVTQTVYWEPQD